MNQRTLKFLPRQILCLVITAAITAGWLQADETANRRQLLRQAIDQGIFNLYEIPLENYIRLEMWEEIGEIFDVNNRIVMSVPLPSLYCSRPYHIHGRIWVFEQGISGHGTAYQFCPDSLNLLEKIIKPEFAAYEGGIRFIDNRTIIAGGSGAAKDVDGAALWNTQDDSVRTVTLQKGHYVCAIHVSQNTLYIGSCGEIIGVWDMETLAYLGEYSVPPHINSAWYEKECINSIDITADKLFGVGEKSIFIWNLADGTFKKKIPKTLLGSIDYLHKGRLYAFRGDHCVVQALDTGKIIADLTTDNPIEDLIVTSENIIGHQTGDIMIISLRRGKGFHFYDIQNFSLISRFHSQGHTLTPFQNSLFSTDSKNLYRYQFLSASPEAYQRFLDQITPDTLPLTDSAYQRLIDHLAQFPNIVQRTGIAAQYMNLKELSLQHRLKYFQVSPRIAASSETLTSNFGYQANFQIFNNSEHHYFINLTGAWSGTYDTQNQQHLDNYHAVHQSFFIAPQEKYSGEIFVGEKEPRHIVFYPSTAIRQVDKQYAEGFKQAVCPNNKQISLINQYLEDDLVKNWHDTLRQRKQELTSNKKGCWLLDLFR